MVEVSSFVIGQYKGLYSAVTQWERLLILVHAMPKDILRRPDSVL